MLIMESMINRLIEPNKKKFLKKIIALLKKISLVHLSDFEL